eukprot:gnl/Spiro4/13597_TR7244_c0_g1_i1.p1 gnl/Spiro4/13597_TR7244_c0_g1~~gnl/Spiro4/13597_TR7244_c0_g1_i1.p1  ORF type:complete len:302 (-),score=60.90 gnl/Spiro4/13597_TR7244_c0_g1_i1:102-1007(-)
MLPVTTATAAIVPTTAATAPVVVVRNLDFSIDGVKILDNLSFELFRGTCNLLVGANGAGKSTLLRVLAGKHMHDPDAVRVLGSSAFHDTSLELRRAFLGQAWTKTVAFAGFGLAHQADISVKDLRADLQLGNPDRCRMLYNILQINPSWRMHQISDGQRRRVQLMLGLLAPSEVVLIDEFTVDLDVVARADFLAFLRTEATQRGVTVLYATHIFDGLDAWTDRLIYLAEGKIKHDAPLNNVPEYVAFREGGHPSPLLRTVDSWIRTETAHRAPPPAEFETAPSIVSNSETRMAPRFYNYWR